MVTIDIDLNKLSDEALRLYLAFKEELEDEIEHSKKQEKKSMIPPVPPKMQDYDDLDDEGSEMSYR